MQRGWYGFKPVPAPLLTAPRDNVKFAKTATPTYGLCLSPAMTSQWNACTHSTRTCRKNCVCAFAGKGGLSVVQRGRLWRTALWAEAPDAAYRLLTYEIGRAITRHNGPIRVRLNTFSDVAWENVLPDAFWRYWGDYVRFYDTKDPKQALVSKHWRYPYKLTFSASERTARFPDQSTLRRLQRLTPRTIRQLVRLHDHLRRRLFARPHPPSRLIFDVDSVVLTLYGEQQGARVGYNPRKRGRRSYHPLLCFEASRQEFWHGSLRPGDAVTNSGVIHFLRRCLAKVPPSLARRRIRVRADAGYFSGKLIGWLENQGLGYVVVAREYRGIKARAQAARFQKLRHGWEVASFSYAPTRWKKPRRFVVVRRHARPIRPRPND